MDSEKETGLAPEAWKTLRATYKIAGSQALAERLKSIRDEEGRAGIPELDDHKRKGKRGGQPKVKVAK